MTYDVNTQKNYIKITETNSSLNGKTVSIVMTRTEPHSSTQTKEKNLLINVEMQKNQEVDYGFV